jgi:hypothetical protein
LSEAETTLLGQGQGCALWRVLYKMFEEATQFRVKNNSDNKRPRKPRNDRGFRLATRISAPVYALALLLAFFRNRR